MLPVRLFSLASFLAATSLVSTALADTTLINDGFTATEHPGASLTGVPPAGNFLSASSNGATGGTASIVNNALQLNDTDTSTSSTALAIALLSSSALLTTTGDAITLGFTFKFINTINSSTTLRFGLYNSNNTAAATGSGSDNDFGYYVSLASTGSATNGLFFREDGTNQGIMGGASDRTNLASNAVSPTLSTNTTYTAGLALTRTASGIDLAFSISGGAIVGTTTLTGATSASLYTSFDELAFNTAFNANSDASDVEIDNVSLTATSVAPIPEPSSALLAGGGLLAIGASRRRNRRK